MFLTIRGKGTGNISVLFTFVKVWINVRVSYSQSCWGWSL